MRAASVVLAISAALASGCGGAGPEAQQASGITVSLDSVAPFVQSADFSDRLESTIQAALDYWGGTWADLDGTTLTLTDADSVDCTGGPSLGCYSSGRLSVTTRDPSLGTLACVEATVLVHEVGHAVIGDARHDDPRWMQMDELGERLSGRVGYAADGSTTDCVVYVSIWRHPLGSR